MTVHQISTIWRFLLQAALVCLLLQGCAAPPPHGNMPASAAQAQLTFIDIGRFDTELASSLSSGHPSVDILFYEKISPNKLPDRLQHWLTAVENSGGKVRVELPPQDPPSRSILTVLGLLGTAYSALKDYMAQQPPRIFQAAKGRDAVINLERGPSGELVVGKIQFVR